MKVQVVVTLKPTVLDPQGKAIHHALRGLGFDSVKSVRAGKVFDLVFNETDEDKIKDQVESMAKRLLSNPVIENFSYRIVEK